MLVNLEIHDFAIIDELRIHFGPGLNAITGETGAGKSILVDALGAVLGGRVSSDLVRTGAKTAYIDATFDLSQNAASGGVLNSLAESGIDAGQNELILSREVQSTGRSSARMNGRVVTAAALASVGEALVDIHGQSDHLSLLRPSAQLEILDQFAGMDSERESFRLLVREWRRILSALADLAGGARSRAQRKDLLGFQINEIGEAGLRAGEDEALEIERVRLVNAERLVGDANTAVALLAGEQAGTDETRSISDGLKLAARTLAATAELDPALTSAVDRIQDFAFQVDDIVDELRQYGDAIEADPVRLSWILERLDQIRNLKRKYGESVDAVLNHLSQAEVELDLLNSTEFDEGTFREEIVALRKRIESSSTFLRTRRTVAADELSTRATEAAESLNLGGAAFVIGLQPIIGEPGFDSTGADTVEFLFSANHGEPPKALARIASGGETARIMLALKAVLAESDQTPTLIFDEIDVGIGGRSGQVVGEKLAALALSHQVIVITHLPQIAAFADQHFLIRKEASGGRTTSRVAELEGTERIAELAAMLDGLPVTDTSRRAAEEMLGRSRALV